MQRIVDAANLKRMSTILHKFCNLSTLFMVVMKMIHHKRGMMEEICMFYMDLHSRYTHTGRVNAFTRPAA